MTRPNHNRPTGNRPRRARVVVVAGFVMAWWAVMIVGAGSGNADRALRIPDLEDAITAVFVLMLIAGALILVMSILDRGPRPRTARKRGGLAGLIFAILVGLALNQFVDRSDGTKNELESAEPAPVTTVPEVPTSRPDDATEQQLTLLAVAAVAVLVAAFLIQRSRRPEPTVDTDPGDDRTVAVVARGLAMTAQRLRAEPDPRRAVLLAYAGLESELDQAGRGRAAHETPNEFVVRILHLMAVDPEPVELLAGLYHDARYSDRAITAAEQERAATAFERAHGQLMGHPTAGGHR